MKVNEFYQILKDNSVNCFCGVPDSLLKDFCAYITDNVESKNHIITANEGNAIALASGHYLATGDVAVVYMQNSGLGNCVNPLLSLTDEEVYNIPVLMLIGWRGEPGIKDEPQHIKQGKLTGSLLESMGINYSILPSDINDARKAIDQAFCYMGDTKKPYAFLVSKSTFEKYTLLNKKQNNAELTREESIVEVAKMLSSDDIVVSTTGQISRELYEYRENNSLLHQSDFLTVGSMGHASSIALGIALQKPERNVYCFDGDGALLMHMGALPVISSFKLNNFKHVVFNNEAHDSVGSQPTSCDVVDIKKMALACGYDSVITVSSKKELSKKISEFIKGNGTCLLEIKVKCGAREDLGRPKETPVENKKSFMSFLNENKTFVGRNSIKNLETIIKTEKAQNVLIFTGKKSFEPINKIVKKYIKGTKITYYCDFSNNPKADEVMAAVQKLGSNYDLILAVGGGSVIDFAKLYKFCIDNNLDIKDAFSKNIKIQSKTKLVAIPTTAGTGSEATQFAVVYIDGIKHSLEDKTVLPDYAIVDSQFVEKMPQYIKACCALDAYCQAIESFFSVNSTKESISYAKKSIELCRDNLVEYVNSNDEKKALNMSLASNLAGKAINISKTTAAHAISYTLTSKFGLPHGHAVALSIANLIKYNLQIDEASNQDKRGSDFVKSQMQELYSILKIEDPVIYFISLFERVGLDYNLKKLGIEDLSCIISSVDKNRLKNNPKILSTQELEKILIND